MVNENPTLFEEVIEDEVYEAPTSKEEDTKETSEEREEHDLKKDDTLSQEQQKEKKEKEQLDKKKIKEEKEKEREAKIEKLETERRRFQMMAMDKNNSEALQKEAEEAADAANYFESMLDHTRPRDAASCLVQSAEINYKLEKRDVYETMNDPFKKTKKEKRSFGKIVAMNTPIQGTEEEENTHE